MNLSVSFIEIEDLIFIAMMAAFLGISYYYLKKHGHYQEPDEEKKDGQ